MNRKKRSNLWLYFALIVFITIAAVLLVIMGTWFLLYAHDFVSINPIERHFPIRSLLVASIIIGLSIALFVGKKIIKPIEELNQAFDSLAKGDFAVTLDSSNKIHELRDIFDNFNTMVKELSQIETLRNDFIENVSHEFKTPIANIEGYATLLQHAEINPREKTYYVTKVLENTQQLSTLTGNILSLSKLDNQEVSVKKINYRLDEQIRKCILLLEPKWTLKNINWDLNLDSIVFSGNEGLMNQVWLNLLDNAIKFSNNNGLISIQIYRKNHEIMINLTDHGQGMTPETLSRLFEKFYQADQTRSSSGNGLGLALVKRVIELHNGTISVNSCINEGTEYIICLQTEKSN